MSKITREMISEELKNKALEALRNGTFLDKEVRGQLKQGLKEQFPDRSPREINSAIRVLRGMEAMPAGQEMQEAETQEELSAIKNFNQNLKRAFTYKGRGLTYANLEGGDFNIDKVAINQPPPENIGSILQELGEFAKTTNDETIINNTNKLIQSHMKDQEAREKPVKQAKVIDVAWAEDIGNLDLGNLKSRQRIYDYWEGIYDKHGALEDAIKEFRTTLTGLENFAEESTEKETFDSFIEASNIFLQETKDNIPNYVLKLDPFEMPVDNKFRNAISILDEFNNLRGVLPSQSKEEDMGMQDERGNRPDEVSEGAGQTGQEALESDRQEQAPTTTYDASLPDMSGRSKPDTRPVSKNKMNVDPIFWYKFSEDFSKIKIPKRQLQQIKEIINGVQERQLQPTEEGGEVRVIPATIGLKYRYMGRMEEGAYVLDEQALDDFDAWFSKFEANLDDIRDESTFYLPLSKFVDRYLTTVKDGKFSSPDKTITDPTVKFLDAVAKLAESYKTSFSVYQQQRGEKGQPREVIGSAPLAAWAGERGKDRKIPEQVDKPWNDLLKAINDYYLVPLQGRNYVQAKEKPTWATGHSAMILSIKNAKRNAIGALLDRMVSESIHLVRPKNIKAITEFIQEARQTGARAFRKDIFSKGRKAVKALDALFGENYSSKNKTSIGYIIYDMAKKLNVRNIEGMAKGYWADIEDLHSRYEESNQDEYPITMLRYALNTPEFKAWLNLDGSGKYDYTDPDLAKRIAELDKEFDSFHKMDNVNTSLLEAHDTIRKMQNKNVVYSHLSLDSIEHMDLVINKIHTEQRMDITATEINKIVKAVASYESISRNFGLNEETIYTVKAMFR